MKQEKKEAIKRLSEWGISCSTDTHMSCFFNASYEDLEKLILEIAKDLTK